MLLDALAQQTYGDYEVVVVDDGSEDGSADEAEADARAGRPVRLVRLPGVGAVAARQAGVSQARGDVLAFTDSDCLPQPQWLAAGLEALDRGADVVQGLTRPARPPGPLERTVVADRYDCLYATCNAFYRRDAFEAAGGFDGSAARRLGFRVNDRARRLGFGEDTLLGWRVRRAGSAAFAPAAVVEHQVFPPDLLDAVSRAVMAGAFPALVREVPELRHTLLFQGFLLNPKHAPLFAAVVALILRRRGAVAVLAGCWAAAHWRDLAWVAPPRRRLVVTGVQVALDLATAASLAAGSARAGTLVL
jgi:glycosyltransferase involved in cell wall biosynthesis